MGWEGGPGLASFLPRRGLGLMLRVYSRLCSELRDGDGTTDLALSSPRLLCCLPSSPSPRARASRLAGEKSRPWSPSASYDLRERLCPGSALGNPGGPEQQVPTDEAEAQMLGSADLDDMKSE